MSSSPLANGDLEFTIVGSSGFARDAPLSPYERELRLLAGQVRAPVRFEPFVDRTALPGLMRDADVLEIRSRWPDPCPLTVGEGLARIAAPSSGSPGAGGPARIEP